MARRATLDGITIRDLGPGLTERLRVRAANNGRSVQAEARSILQGALDGPDEPQAGNLYERVHGRFTALGGVDVDPPPRVPGREPPRFE